MGLFGTPAFRAAFLVVLCFVFYGNTVGNDYAFDDAVVITENQFTQRGFSGIPDIFANNTFRGSYDGRPTIERYRPLSVATFAVEHDLFGNNPAISHVGNILLLAWVVLAFYALVRKLFGGAPGAGGNLDAPFVAALLFIAHPVHTEIVANLKGRDELLALAGALSATLLLLRYAESGRRRQWLGAGFFFLVALFSKENAIAFLAIIPLTLYYQGKADKAAYVRSLALLAGLGVFFLGARALALRGPDLPPTADILSDPFVYATTSQRIATAFAAVGRYLRLLVFPHPLTIDYYPFQIPLASWTDARVWIGLVLLVGTGAFAIWTVKRRSVAAYGILFFLLSFSIVSNLPFSIGTLLSERFLFIPSAGFILVVAWLFARRLPLANLPKALVLSVLLAACLVKTVGRNGAWKNDFTLFTTDAKTSVDSIKGNLAATVSYLAEAQKVGEGAQAAGYAAAALWHATRAVSLFERHLSPTQLQASPYASAVELLGNCYAANGKLDDALQAYRKIYTRAADRGHLSAMVEQAIEKSDDVDFKIKTYLEFARQDPNNFMFNYRLGYAYGKDKNDLVMSVHYLTKAVEIRPDEPLALEALSHAHKLSRNYGQAAAILEKAAALKPGDDSYARKLVGLYQQAGDDAKVEEWLGRLNGP